MTPLKSQKMYTYIDNAPLLAFLDNNRVAVDRLAHKQTLMTAALVVVAA